MSKYTKEEHYQASDIINQQFQKIPLDMLEAALMYLNNETATIDDYVIQPSNDLLLEEFLESNSSIDCVEEVFLNYYDDEENIVELLANRPEFKTIEEVAKDTAENHRYSFITDNGFEEAVLETRDFEEWKNERLDENYPMWNTLFLTNSPSIDADILWQNGMGMIDSEWGNLIFFSGAGYDFYESHWIPLFKQLKWII